MISLVFCHSDKMCNFSVGGAAFGRWPLMKPIQINIPSPLRQMYYEVKHVSMMCNSVKSYLDTHSQSFK